MQPPPVPSPVSSDTRHEALLYSGEAEFLDAVRGFVLDGLDADEAVLVVLTPQRLNLVEDRLGAAAADRRVAFLDIETVSQNPSRLLPALRRRFDEMASPMGSVRAVGEPVWPGRSAAAVVETQRHEALVNLAFHTDRRVLLLCPYDVESLPEPVLDAALRTHPYVIRDGTAQVSPAFQAEEMATAFLDVPLPEPTVPFRELEFGFGELHVVRAMVAMFLDATAMSRDRGYDLLLAASEVATNSVIHGGGIGNFRVWVNSDTVVCEFRDSGHLDDPMAGRWCPPLESFGHRGLWIVNQLCDLAQIRVFPSGTVVRLHMAIG